MMKGREGGVSGLLPLMFLGGKNDFMDDLFDFGDGEETEDDGLNDEETEDGEV